MAVDWTPPERAEIERGIADHGVDTGRCAALARIVYRVAKPRDPGIRALHVRPAAGARWLVPKASHVPYWGSHTYVETEKHAVDAVSGADGHYPSHDYLQSYWEYAGTIRVTEVDPAVIDPGIQDVDRER